MRLPTSELYTAADFNLTTGAVLPRLDIAYETWGELNAARDNTILLCHGYTNNPHAGPPDGWFSNLLGPGKAVDTNRYFVVCSNMLGSSFGTSGPQSTDQRTGQPFGPDFPKFTTRDMIAVQEILLDHLGIGDLRAVIGYSYGGHLTYLWGALHPDRMRALVPIAATIRRETTPEQITKIRDGFALCPGWNGGHYHGQEAESGVYDALVSARLERMRLYGMGKHLEDTVADPEERERILLTRAKGWAREFDANSLAMLYEAGIGSEADPTRIKAPLLNVLANTDSVVDVAQGQPTVDAINATGGNARFLELDTPYGHAGPMIDAHKWEHDLRAFMEEHA
ncbi:MAG: alpha/beta fold hydrolase [Paracoccaceae bacterium]